MWYLPTKSLYKKKRLETEIDEKVQDTYHISLFYIRDCKQLYIKDQLTSESRKENGSYYAWQCWRVMPFRVSVNENNQKGAIILEVTRRKEKSGHQSQEKFSL